MKLLSRTSARFDSWLVTDAGLRFRGAIQPLSDGGATTTTYLEPRHAMHTRPDEPVNVRDIIIDAFGQRYLVADHGARAGLQKVFRLFHLTQQMSWRRPFTVTEPITGLERNLGDKEIGPIWVATEIYGREEVDRGLHIGMDRMRIITGAELTLNDKIDGMMVRRIATTYGVTVAEIQ